MSRRKRRMTRRQWSSCSSKRSYSPFIYEQHNKILCDCATCKNGMAEKEADSFQMESSIVESDEGGEKEADILFKEKQFRRNNYGETFKKRRRASISAAGNRERGLEIITSVMVNGRKVSRIVFRQSQDSTCRSQVHGKMAVTTTKVKYTGRRVKVEAKGILRSSKSKFETFDTFTMHRGRRQRNKASSTKHWERCSTPDDNKLPNVYSPSQSSTTGSCSTANEKYQFRRVERDHDMGKDIVGSNYNEEIVCCKSCCDDDKLYDHHPMLPEGILSTCSVSEVYTQENQSPTNVTCPQALSDTSPPQEFADGDRSSLEDLTQEIASCHISSDDTFHRQVEMHLHIPENEIISRHFSVQDFSSGTLFHQLSLLDTYWPLFMKPKMVIRRSSFDKDFILNYEGKCSVRNNSTGILEAKSRISYYLSKHFKRSKTFPGSEDSSKRRKDYLPLHTESFSSEILSPFFMQSLQLQAMTASAQVDVEDERPFIFHTVRRKSSEISISHFESNSPPPYISSYRQTRNPYYPSKVGSSYENDAQHCKMPNENMVALNMTFGDNVHMKESSLDKHRTGSLDQTDGFDQETLEAEEVSTEEPMMKDLLIHVTPSSSTSQDLLCKDGTVLSKPPWLLANKSSSLVKNRSSSVITIITGGSEQRHLHNDAKPADVSEPGIHQNFFSTVHERSSASPVPHMEDKENNNDAVHEVSLPLQCSSPPTGTNSAVQILLETLEVDSLSADETNTTAAIDSGGFERRTSINAEKEESVTLTEITCSIVGPQDKLSTNNKSEMWKTDPDEKQTFATTYVDGKVDALEHLRPPEPALKDIEEARDRWAKRRKLFKESKQWSSAGGSSVTSNITEESVNSEDTHSVDLNMRDIEDRGFYTETFHSASWMYCGDEAHSDNDPGCLRKRPRPVTIRERTVRISKGTGEYPWGFRIQFSKPIVVTEVDTNGAAEEAGLQVGDYVLSVNGTDVSSVPHSEAAELARRGYRNTRLSTV
nr:uncharacterized protein LOC111841167 [Paramormyrops kingsleyae]